MTRFGTPFLEERGLQKVHVLCLRRDVNGLLRLLPNTAAVEARTSNGETPLMLSALMGHIEIVVILRQNRASLEPVDNFGMTALAYTAETAFTEARRGNFSGFFPEADFSAYRRIAIAGFLSPAMPGPQPHTGTALGPMYIRQNSNGIEAYRSLGSVHTPHCDPRTKTVAFITSHSDADPKAWAVSGWRPLDLDPTSKLLDGERWTEASLLRVAPVVGYAFKPHINDQGFQAGQIADNKKGRFFASHAECQLATWYCTTVLASVKSMPDASITFLARNLSDLARADIGDARQVQINITQPPCESCARFLQAITKVTGIRFDVVYRRSIALVPEAFKRRNYLLAHQANLEELDAEDNGSDAGWACEDHDVVDRESFVAWQNNLEANAILEGIEEYEVRPFDAYAKVNEANESQEPQDDDENEEDEVIEDHDDAAMDGTYRGVRARQQSPPEHDHHEPATSSDDTDDEPGIVWGTPIPSAPASPSNHVTATPRTPRGSLGEPIEIPATPSDMVIARRRHFQKRQEWSEQYQMKKQWGRRRGELKVKKETQERLMKSVTQKKASPAVSRTRTPSSAASSQVEAASPNQQAEGHPRAANEVLESTPAVSSPEVLKYSAVAKAVTSSPVSSNLEFSVIEFFGG
ncbi:Ankyrin repeat and EF-hand [Pestalotiopsis sp. IQ-011]